MRRYLWPQDLFLSPSTRNTPGTPRTRRDGSSDCAGPAASPTVRHRDQGPGPRPKEHRPPPAPGPAPRALRSTRDPRPPASPGPARPFPPPPPRYLAAPAPPDAAQQRPPPLTAAAPAASAAAILAHPAGQFRRRRVTSRRAMTPRRARGPAPVFVFLSPTALPPSFKGKRGRAEVSEVKI